MTTVQQVINRQAYPEIPINENFETLSAAGIFGKRHPDTTGLTWAYYGGLYNGNTIADGTVTLTNAADNYVVVLRSTGVVSTSTSSANSTNPLYAKLYKVTCASGVVSAVVDQRWDANGLLFNPGGTFTGGTLTSALNEAPTVTIASSATPAIFSAAGNTISMTGTTTVTGFDTIASGAVRRVVFTGVLQLTYNATSMINITGANITTAAGDSAEFLSLGSGNTRMLRYQRANGQALAGGVQSIAIPIAVSDETTALTTGTAKVTFRMPYAFTLTAVRSSVTTAPTGSTLVVDINEGGTTILSTKLSIDAGEKTSTTAATPAVISDTALADDAEITIDIDQIGSTIAGAGLKVYLIGTSP